jgi:hypothetical protein
MATSKLSWITPPGTIANFPIGDSVTVTLLVVDTNNTGATFTFSIIGGNLPPGLVLSSDGIISGTPEYSATLDNYFTTLNYDFFVRVISSDGRVLDGKFIIIVSNIVNQDFTWITPAGTLGTVPNGQFYSLRLEADSTNNLGVTYSFVSGELPPGMQLISQQVDKTVTTSQFTNNAVLKLNNTQTISVNDYVFGTKIPANTRVSNVNIATNTVQLSTNTSSVVNAGEIIRFYSPGFLQGVPTILDPVAVNESRNYRFTIRATNSLGRINDRAFNLTVTNIYGPIIEPEINNLGSFFDGTYYEQQLQVIQLNPSVVIKWEVVAGELPLGLTLDQNGVISGYLQPIKSQLVGMYGPSGYDGYLTTANIVTSEQEYDTGPYQFNQLNNSLGYTFTVQAFDGANYDLQTYTFRTIAATTGWTADNDVLTIDDGFLSVGQDSIYYPFIRNRTGDMPPGRQDSYYAFKVDGYDWELESGTTGLVYRLVDTQGTYDGNPFDPLNRDDLNNGLPGSFDLVSATTSNLPGVFLDEDSGWIYGKLNEQTTALEEYTFGVEVCKTVGNVEYCSPPKYFTLPVIGDPNSIINWVSPSDLGTIDNGTVSELAIQAVSTINKDLIYTLVDRRGVSCRLPQGLTLLPTGEISGRATFEAFTIDDYATTIDNDQLTFDQTAVFTVQAETTDATTSITRTFTLKLNIVDQEPYENLYLKAMPQIQQRQIYNSLISNTSIFDPEYIYRAEDPYFGIQQQLRMIFLPGLTASELQEYQDAMIRNHFNKVYTFGNVKTAYVLDDTYEIKYEVVYVEVVDPGENSDGTGPKSMIDLTGIIANTYIDQNGNTTYDDGISYDIVYPNSSENMTNRLENAIGYQNQSSLPAWMSSNQPDPNTDNGFTIPLGYTKAVVIAYTKPGFGEKIAYRIRESGIDFNRIEFVADRYQVDNHYSKNYKIDNLTYIADRETTFDSDPNINVGTIVVSVNYAVTVPYNQINGRPVDYIIANGGIDGVENFQDGDTLVFAKQEQFEDPGPYDGWVDYSSSYLGDNTETEIIEGYDSGPYDTYTVVPGFLEKSQATADQNKRGGVWQIQIVGGIVNLVFLQEITVNDRIRVLFGKTLSSAILVYSIDLVAGQTVPFYQVFTFNPTVRRRTTFNNDSTRFFTYRDQYYVPGTQDKYVKFPQYGVFN